MIDVFEGNKFVDNKIIKKITNPPKNKDERLTICNDKLLGKGAYGEIFLAIDQDKKQYAIKRCNLNDKGIPLIEAIIMSEFIHPHINRAIGVYVSEQKLYILQNLAQTDLCFHTRKRKGYNPPSLDTLKYWSNCICQAILALHDNLYIHADIKANNILLYPDGSIKLTDFSLSLKKIHENEFFSHKVCTRTHRPLEVLCKKSWDERVDIWALGCTLYEIAYGELLFPYQGEKGLRQQYINAILKWNKSIDHEYYDHSVSFVPSIIGKDFGNNKLKSFNAFLSTLLIVDIKDRPTIKEVLNHNFIKTDRKIVCLRLKRPQYTKIHNMDHMERYLINLHDGDETICEERKNAIIERACDIYNKCRDLSINHDDKSEACTWIASKLIYGNMSHFNNPSSTLLQHEKDICHNLDFLI